MQERVVDILNNVALAKRQKKLLAMFPGLMFGFPPPNFDEMMKRFDCLTCQDILAIKIKQTEIIAQLQEGIAHYGWPIKNRNEIRKAQFESRRRIPIIGRFVKSPRYELDPDYTYQLWYIGGKKDWNVLQDECYRLYEKDAAHWYGEANTKVSNEFVSAYLGKDSHWSMSSLYKKSAE